MSTKAMKGGPGRASDRKKGARNLNGSQNIGKHQGNLGHSATAVKGGKLAASEKARNRAVTSLSQPISRKIQTKLDKRRRLVAAARQLFVEQGYEATRPQDVARIADVGYGTFYDNFSDKSECFFAVVQDAEWELFKVVQWHWSPELDKPEEFFPIMLRSTFEYSAINPGVVGLLMSDARPMYMGGKEAGNSRYKHLSDRIEHWQKTGSASRDLDKKLVIQLLWAIVRLGDTLVAENPRNINKIVTYLTNIMVGAVKNSPVPLAGR